MIPFFHFMLLFTLFLNCFHQVNDFEQVIVSAKNHRLKQTNGISGALLPTLINTIALPSYQSKVLGQPVLKPQFCAS